jgi:apolipoprotein N-acyltransferase
MTPARRRVLAARARAVLWALTLPAALLWWPASVAFVIICSVYANAESAWGSAEAADDSALQAELRSIRDELAALRQHLEPDRG